ncbi:TetR/AcrR family transcriptional regulator [Streptomyces filamentosus]|uniref:TetR/AcrR family transcriptional regulator n=2 Tax=Streptomyces filamentosus TaxID=67294 RepID=A0ABY4V4N0_STRFL|nr:MULTISPECIES: TetR family transcriptional regulator [Streptomyces]EFE78692.1 regulatory protein [Streptomyces filamentosus NRRL 15998]ESU47069.1 TetR family transcriptional regulator [Streptomyces sp. HCCB10043]EWS95558.1 TetR family transcriptional regulator [Streptomyces filamentosus NRRL 11379]MYR82549.1 TetR family transcriptional regulator [Streptomyces sp. SID5466]USC51476.1 TetR/AcrR family transcriptional regulator [Streptomyces filamentosus]
MREVLAQAAFQLFLERGFERTTVDDIVARAGVGRRSFFRYFPSKEDAVFPDHERCLAEMTEFLAAADDGDPVGAVSDAARIVLRMYAANPEFSVQRYRLTREVPGLRTYELSVVRRYEQTLAGHLRSRFGADGDGALRAEVIAASVVAAHNNGLRLWLRSGGEGDPEVAVDHALAMVREVWGRRDVPATPTAPAAPEVSVVPAAPLAVSGGGGGGGDGEVVVMVARKGTPMWRVVQQIESAVGEN